MPSYGSGENLFWRGWSQGQCLEVLRQPFNNSPPWLLQNCTGYFSLKSLLTVSAPTQYIQQSSNQCLSLLPMHAVFIHHICNSYLLPVAALAFVPSPSQSFCVLKRTLNLVSMKQVRGTWRRGGGCRGLRCIPVLVTLFISWQGKSLFCILFQGHAVNDVGEGMHVRHRGRRWKQLIVLNPHSGGKGRCVLVHSAGLRFVGSGPQPVDWHSQHSFTLQTTGIHLAVHQQSSMSGEDVMCVWTVQL